MIRPIAAPVNFVRRHKVAVAIVGTAVICVYFERKAMVMHDEFLMANGLYEKFYAKA